MKLSWVEKFEATKPFTEPQAWALFKFAAFGEAFGWAVLITGITIQQLHLPGQNIAVPIAGTVHGTFFLLYYGAAMATYTSLNWSRLKFLTALVAGVPPLGSLIFEIWAAKVRERELRGAFRKVIVRAFIEHEGKVLAWESSEAAGWQLPGGEVKKNETGEEALERILVELTGMVPQSDFKSITQTTTTLTLIFTVKNAAKYAKVDWQAILQKYSLLDEIGFVKPELLV